MSKAVEKSFLDKETSVARLLGFHEKSQSEKASFYLKWYVLSIYFDEKCIWAEMIRRVLDWLKFRYCEKPTNTLLSSVKIQVENLF